MNLDLTHLDPAIHELASADAGERIRMISKDLFIQHEYSQHLNDTLDARWLSPGTGECRVG